jgi:hypothetical protein
MPLTLIKPQAYLHIIRDTILRWLQIAKFVDMTMDYDKYMYV